jgi:hypothetical protein
MKKPETATINSLNLLAALMQIIPPYQLVRFQAKYLTHALCQNFGGRQSVYSTSST